MTAQSVNPPFPIFNDVDGNPLEDGFIYIGTENLNPETNLISVYWDAALTIPTAQPIRTLGGYPSRAGTPARIFADSNYSITVRNKNGTFIYSSASVTDIFSADLVNFIQSGTGAIPRTAQSKMREIPSVDDFGAVGSGLVDDSAAINAALTAHNAVSFTAGKSYLINSSIILTSNKELYFEGGAQLLAGTNGMTMISAPVAAYGAKLFNPNLNANAKTNVTGLNTLNMRLFGACINNISMTGGLTNGMVLENCFGLTILNPSTFNTVLNPVIVLDNCASLNIINPSFDNETGGLVGTGIGIDIRAGVIGNTGVIITGGFIQGYSKGISDAAANTKVSGTYFEVNTLADIYSVGARSFIYSGIINSANIGAVAFYGRNCDAGTIFQPTMPGGARTNGLFDFDATNTNCFYYDAGSNAGWNAVGPMAIGIGTLAKETSGTFVPIVIGGTTSGVGTYTSQSGTWRKIGKRVFVDLVVSWSAHTGTGATVITGIPASLSTAFAPLAKGAIQITSAAFTGPTLFTQFNGTGSNMSVIEVATTGVISFLAIPAAGAILVQINFEADHF